ncbi:MAG: PAS domain S-box protein [Candidatus Baltobacteraceae bacterium]
MDDVRAALLAAIVDSSDDAIVSTTPEGIVTSWNRAAEALFGYPAGEIVGKPVSLLYHPQRPDEMDEIGRKLRRGERVEHYETLRVRKDGETIAISITVSPIHDSTGRLVGVSSIARDVTDRERAGQKLLAASQYARSLIEASPDALATISPEGKITDVNAASVEMTGASRQELIGADFSDYFTEPEKAREGYKLAFEEGAVSDFPLTFRHRSGKLTDVFYNASVYKDAGGHVLGVVASARDMTAQKQASQYARSLIEASLDPFVTISPEGKITDVNEAAVKVTGVPRERLIGTDFSDYFTEPEKARDGYLRVFSAGYVTDYPLTVRHRDGRHTDVLYNASVYKNAAGNVLGVFAAARDITSQRRAEAEVAEQRQRELERLAELERFQRLTIGRELRMIELKKENEELRQERERLRAAAPAEGP